jgi:hypothetical protein
MKTFTVANEIQKTVVDYILKNHMKTGFWGRPSTKPVAHAEYWEDVEVKVGTELGASGFIIPRRYNFANSDFLKEYDSALIEVASEVQPGIKLPELRSEMMALNQIIGGRWKNINDKPIRIKTKNGVESIYKSSTHTVRRHPASFGEVQNAH